MLDLFCAMKDVEEDNLILPQNISLKRKGLAQDFFHQFCEVNNLEKNFPKKFKLNINM
jgi:hypothetical protein